jgi:transcriptional regulator GlxA family with amidase domain
MAKTVRPAQSPDVSERARRVLVLVLPHVHLQDLGGPVQVLFEAAQLGGCYKLCFCGVERDVRSAQGLELAQLEPLPEVQSTDVVLVPGMSSSTIDRLDHVPVQWLRDAQRAGARIVSVCSGAFALARAGLLDGRQCTTHWKLVHRLRRAAPRADVLENRLFVEDRGVVTSAGVAAGIDMALALVERDHGPLVAARVAREMVVYVRRSGDREQLSIYLDHRTHLNPGVHQVQDFIVQHPELKPKLEQLAQIAAMSPRNLTRVFSRATGITPKQFASKVKLQVARDLIDDPQRSVQAIASSCGFDDARQLRRLWKQTFGVSIANFRATRSRAAESRAS